VLVLEISFSFVVWWIYLMPSQFKPISGCMVTISTHSFLLYSLRNGRRMWGKRTRVCLCWMVNEREKIQVHMCIPHHTRSRHIMLTQACWRPRARKKQKRVFRNWKKKLQQFLAIIACNLSANFFILLVHYNMLDLKNAWKNILELKYTHQMKGSDHGFSRLMRGS
jgi:hypothetical protein